MIKANELRIGNSAKLFLGVGDSGPEYREVVITGLKTDRDQRIRIDSSDYWHPVENFEPIPLTEEWLLRFGFEYEKQTIGGWERWEIKTDKGNRIKILDKKFTWGVGEYSDYILYVHQLQNLYFALTGTELELKQTL